ncbi:MAG: hypothetical protein IGS54_30580 [Elainella sp. C42_A2020_010]|nr:hypothetical protein [Elainella sp. C42_A2020_010]
MKPLKTILVCLVVLINLLIAQPAFADAPKLDKNPDYQQITATLSELLQARETQQLPEGLASAQELQQKITELQYQKYIVESGKGVTECFNNTGRTIAVYGPTGKKSKSKFDNTLYLLPSGAATDDDWNCEGVFLPSDAKVAGLDLGAASATKFLSGTRLTISETPDGAIEFNLPPAQLFQAGDVNWDIPDVTEADLNRQLPQAPTD